MHKKQFVLTAALIFVASAAPAFAESVTLFRVFLNDGTAVVSYGEYARVGDRVVFSMPIGALDPGKVDPTLHIVNLPASAVNWTATTKYADSARLSHYMRTSAEHDYTALAGDIAATLNAVMLAEDPKARLNMAVNARRRLASWPRDHYGYRANDVQEMLGLLDEAIAGLRVAAGETSFALDLVAEAPVPLPVPQTLGTEQVPMLSNPTVAGSLQQALSVAKATDIAADRVSILRSVVAGLDGFRGELPSGWGPAVRERAIRVIQEESRAEIRYANLTTDLLSRATKAAARADVRSVEKVLETAVRRDTQLGRKRPAEINALLEQVRGHLDAARRLRLARDQWRERSAGYRAYMKRVTPIVERLTRARNHLDDIKSLTGSDAKILASLGERLSASVKALGVIAVPDGLKDPHALLTSAANLAERAVKTRRQAAVSGEISVAWDASSAAAGAMALLARAREDMEAAIRVPQTR